MNTTIYYARTKDDCPPAQWQPLLEHLSLTAKTAAAFAAEFNCAYMGGVIGYHHDLGKYSQPFQNRLHKALHKVDHSTAGALELSRLGHLQHLGRLLAYCVMGHHGGLPDTGSKSTPGSFKMRLDKEIPDYSAFKQDLPPYEKCPPAVFNELPCDDFFSLAFLLRMLFSCLVDADRLDSKRFVEGKTLERGGFPDINKLYERFCAYMSKLDAENSPINAKRNAILNTCLTKAEQPRGLYTLTVPTGGGKTLSSLGYALKHAKLYNLRRVIYAIPYTSIIEQNAKVFREVLGDDCLLEHHSNYRFEDKNDTDDSHDNKIKLAVENWDVPVIATTNVQFFESLFANRTGHCRKLHNIANSVIILDEAQMLPVEFLTPCVNVLEILVRFYNCTVVLCSATQPSLSDKFKHLKPIEIMDDPVELEGFFKRVHVEYCGQRNDDALADELLGFEQVLCIVNTRRHAKELYSRLKDFDNAYHLSTLMCPAHRKKKLDEIRARLKNNLPTRVVSTQLIEAGVDVDFSVVYRSAAGIDSIIQSAGRCNRNNALGRLGLVRVFQSGEEYGRPKGYLQRTAVLGERLAKDYTDIICTEAVKDYFEQLYKLEGSSNGVLDKFGILELFTVAPPDKENFAFKTCAEKFSFIDNKTCSIIIPYNDEAKALIEELRHADFPKKCLRKLQVYTVSLYEYDYKDLYNKGALETVSGADVLIDAERYDKENEGLIINKESEAMFR